MGREPGSRNAEPPKTEPTEAVRRRNVSRAMGFGSSTLATRLPREYTRILGETSHDRPAAFHHRRLRPRSCIALAALIIGLIAWLRADVKTDRAEAAQDRRAFQQSMDGFRAEMRTFQTEMQRLAERQSHLEGARSAVGD